MPIITHGESMINAELTIMKIHTIVCSNVVFIMTHETKVFFIYFTRCTFLYYEVHLHYALERSSTSVIISREIRTSLQT